MPVSLPDPSRPGPARPRHRALAAGSAAVVVVAAAAALLAAGPASHPAARRSPARPAHLAASTCSGPAGAAYVADAGWDGFTAINTANCTITQTYNVGDTPVPGDAGDYNYSSTDEAVAMSGHTLYFADTGSDSVGVIDAATLDPKDYNPAETDIHVGFDPGDLAVTPDGSQLWVADTGPQTSPASPAAITVISTAADKVTATLPLPAAPAQIAFAPSGATAYVTTADGLWAYSTATDHVTGIIRGLGDPHGVAVSPDGSTVYVTSTQSGTVAVISAGTGRVTRTITVGPRPGARAGAPPGATL
jgi:YVTN family beta-propeller protein